MNLISRARAAIAVATLSLAAIAQPARAVETLPTTIAEQFDAPVVITECSAWVSDDRNWLNAKASFQDSDPEHALAVKFRFDYADPFGEHLMDRWGVATGFFTPGVAIKNFTWTYLDTSPTAQAVKCSVAMVKFVSGRIWTAPDAEATEPPKSATCRLKLADGTSVDVPADNPACRKKRSS